MSTTAKRALILDGHSRAAVETLQALGKYGVEVDVAAEWDCTAFYSKYARGKLIQPPGHLPQRLAEWIGAQDAKREYRLIVASTESSLQAFRTLPGDNVVRRKALLPGNDSLDTALNKQRTCELAARLHIPVPKTALIDLGSKLPAVEQYPVVLKPIQSAVVSEEGVIFLAPEIVKNESERIAVLEKWLPYVSVQQQEYVAGHGLGIDFLFNQGKKVWYFAHERVHEYPLTGGASTYRHSLYPDSRLLDRAEQLLTVLHWHGVAMVEFKVSRDGSFYLMEINPRLWGSLALSIDAGVNFPLGLWQIASNEALSPQPAYRVPYYTRDLINDLQWQWENFRSNHREALLLTRSRIRCFAEYLRPLLGKESWDHFDVQDLRVTFATFEVIGRRYSKAIQRKVIARLTESKIVSMHRRAMRNLAQRTAPLKSLLFLCYGNICRSPVAEQLARIAFTNLEIESAGFYEREGRPSPQNIISAANRMGIDLVHCSSRCVTKQQIERADLIFVMDANNYSDLVRKYPKAASRTLLLGLFLEQPTVNIPDPYRASDEKTWEVVSQISRAINALACQLYKGLADESHA
jgi:protein-tyrosine-phosphatase/predicted ATP-grasp superfamily ATP-dependent carboligase